MNCPHCGYENVPQGARHCPNCGQALPGTPQPATQIEVRQEVGEVEGGQVTGVDIRQVFGSVSVSYSRSQLEELHDYLARAVAAYETRMYQALVPRADLPEQPYKFLYAYELEDAGLFFGRDEASAALHRTLLQDRLTVLHAPSGAGKTSLLQAGLSPRLIREGRLPVYARAYEEPVRAIKRALAPSSLGPWPELLPRLTLHEFLGLACAYLSRQTRELVILLDQFEGFLIFWPEREHRQPFIHALADCYEDGSLPLRIVLGIRTDYFGHLATFQDRLPHIFHNEYYLDAMTRQQAQEAITKPAIKLGHPVEYEPALLDVLLDDLARGGTELPHLQIICTELYKALSEGQTRITFASYEGLGRAQGILTGYLNGVLERLPGGQRSLAQQILAELVSSEATRRVLGYDALAARIEAEGDELDDVLAWLVDARLLHRDEVAGEIRYEMAHEYLIAEIRGWIDQEDLALKQAEELLERELQTCHLHKTLIPKERLELLYAQRERFRGLDSESWQCILLSAQQADFAVEDWAKLAIERGGRPPLEALGDAHELVRRAAMRGLGEVWGLPYVSQLGDKRPHFRRKAASALGQLGDARTVEPLIAASRDEDDGVRREAIKALGQLGDLAVESLIITLRDEDIGLRRVATQVLGMIWRLQQISCLADEYASTRREAARALGQLGDPRAVEPLLAALKDEDSYVRQYAAVALGQLSDLRAVEPLIAALKDGDEYVHRRAVGALAQLGDPHALEPLVAALQDEDRYVRRYAAVALGQFSDARALAPLLAACRDELSDVRQAAVSALGHLGEPAVKPLIAALQDEDWYVCQAAASALGQLGEPAVKPLIAALRDKDHRVRQRAASVLGQLGKAAVEPLIVALQDEDSCVRQAAASELGRLGDPRAVEPLLAALKDDDSYVRQYAAVALGQLGGLCAVEPLIAALKDEDEYVYRYATEALGQLGAPRAVEPLIAALRDGDLWMRYDAAQALKRIGTLEALTALEEWRREQRDREMDGREEENQDEI